MGKNKAIFLDRDGTINVDYNYVYKKEKLKFLPNAVEGLKRLQELGFLLVIITNQSGIGRGLFSEEEYQDFTDYMLAKLRENGVQIAKVYHCPHLDSDECDCRKPKLGMFERATKELRIELDGSYAVGDKERDLSICEQSKVKGVMVGGEGSMNRDDGGGSMSGGDGGGYVRRKDLMEVYEYVKACGGLG